jgi:type VI protein secretion system component VasF
MSMAIVSILSNLFAAIAYPVQAREFRKAHKLKVNRRVHIMLSVGTWAFAIRALVILLLVLTMGVQLSFKQLVYESLAVIGYLLGVILLPAITPLESSEPPKER